MFNPSEKQQATRMQQFLVQYLTSTRNLGWNQTTDFLNTRTTVLLPEPQLPGTNGALVHGSADVRLFFECTHLPTWIENKTEKASRVNKNKQMKKRNITVLLRLILLDLDTTYGFGRISWPQFILAGNKSMMSEWQSAVKCVPHTVHYSTWRCQTGGKTRTKRKLRWWF